ncbi:triose-phosphate isomerase [Streptomyces griseoincarnatus]
MCLPHPLLPAGVERVRGTGMTIGAQNVWHGEGAVTGEVSADLLAEVGCTHVMVGHAERRRLFDEDDTVIARKAAAVVEAGMTPLICVGEQSRISAAAAAAHVTAQASTALQQLPPRSSALIFYEPLWAIGGAQAAHPNHAATVLERLRAAVTHPAVRLVYGGAVVPGTYTALRAAAPWDGVALGRAARDPGMLGEITAELLAHTPVQGA